MPIPHKGGLDDLVTQQPIPNTMDVAQNMLSFQIKVFNMTIPSIIHMISCKAMCMVAYFWMLLIIEASHLHVQPWYMSSPAVQAWSRSQLTFSLSCLQYQSVLVLSSYHLQLQNDDPLACCASTLLPPSEGKFWGNFLPFSILGTFLNTAERTSGSPLSVINHLTKLIKACIPPRPRYMFLKFSGWSCET